MSNIVSYNVYEMEELTSNFIQDIIDSDLAAGKHNKIHTRFPPEPNGYLHIGHAKSICLNFGTAIKYAGKCNLRFDDTNPSKEEIEYVDSIMNDVRWLGFDWEDRLYYASDYYQQLFDWAVEFIRMGKAYICELSAEEVRNTRGTLTEPGLNSPFRDRSIDENLLLFMKMKNGEFEEGTYTLRAKIDMASPNLNMRDPVMYRIIKASHHRTGNAWCIYPMYDYAHGFCDAIEGITHSICTLEFEAHRPLYDWFLETLDIPNRPRQIEFARLNLTHTVMSKRKLLELVTQNAVSGWDDPRMPTLAGMRRRGYSPEAIRSFCDRIGVAKTNSTIDLELLHYFVREDLNRRCNRVMAVINPLKVVITNYPDGQVEWFDAENNPENPASGTRKIPFSKVIYIEQEDFRENPPPKYHRLSPGKEVRLKHAFYITCTDVIKNTDGEILEVHCTYDPKSKGGWTEDSRKVLGTSHWVSEEHALTAEVRQYDHIFLDDNISSGESQLNPDSMVVLNSCKVEPSLKDAHSGQVFQFLRQGYFCVDKDSNGEKLVFNRTVTLKDTWAKLERKQ